jgi:hypothetical protein
MYHGGVELSRTDSDNVDLDDANFIVAHVEEFLFDSVRSFFDSLSLNTGPKIRRDSDHAECERV